MSTPPLRRLFHAGPLAAGGTVRLDPQASHHALRVLRLAAGDALELFNGDGRRYPARLADADPKAASVAVGEPKVAGTESPLSIGLAQVLPAGDKMDWVVEKAVELGVVAIQPLYARRSVLRLDGERAVRRLEHWRRIAVAACMQCGRDRLPRIGEPMELERWLVACDAPRPASRGAIAAGEAPSTKAAAADPGSEAAPSDAHGEATRPGPGALRLMLSPRGAGALASILPPVDSAWLLAGPEAGLSPEEEARAEAAGWRSMRLGPRTLRTETAGLAAIAALQARLGDLG